MGGPAEISLGAAGALQRPEDGVAPLPFLLLSTAAAAPQVFRQAVALNTQQSLQSFEADARGWTRTMRVPSGANGVTSAQGGFHAVVEGPKAPDTAPTQALTNFPLGGLQHASTVAGGVSHRPFPMNGYQTSVDVYLDPRTAAIGRGFSYMSGFQGSAEIGGALRLQVELQPNGTQAIRITPEFEGATGEEPLIVTEAGWWKLQHSFYVAADGTAAFRISAYQPGAMVPRWEGAPQPLAASGLQGRLMGGFIDIDVATLSFDNSASFMGGGVAELEVVFAPCQDDADPMVGYDVVAEVWLRNPTIDVTGFQAELLFDMSLLDFNLGTSAYDPNAFPLALIPMALANTEPGTLRLASNAPLTGPAWPANTDVRLAVLGFIANEDTCTPQESLIEFNSLPFFPGIVSADGNSLATSLTNAPIITLDDTPPVLSGVPMDIRVAASGPGEAGLGAAAGPLTECEGAFVAFALPAATDNCDPAPVIECCPASGDFFPIGDTPVDCMATDACGNVTVQTFMVAVSATNRFVFDVAQPGSEPGSRWLSLVSSNQSFSCGPFSLMADFQHLGGDPTMPVLATLDVELPCGFGEFSIKDQQHTLWADIFFVPVLELPLVGVGNVFLESDGDLTGDLPTLLSGDTDNDGDVDINDVTLLIAQFGLAATPDPSFDMQFRDADFSNNGVVGLEDYSFQTANFLTFTSSRCIPSFTGGGGGPGAGIRVTKAQVRTAIERRADLNGNGWVDVVDVRLFEEQHGLSGELSRAMAASVGQRR